MVRSETSGINLVLGEVAQVTASMRKNARWASSNAAAGRLPSSVASNMGLRTTGKPKNESGSKSKGGSSLIAAFNTLKIDLAALDYNLSQMDAFALLNPFLEVIRSGDTSGPITAAALSSVDKFLSYGLVHENSPNIALAMASLSSAGTHCKFEASDSTSDEVVLLKILDVIRNTITCPMGTFLTDEAVCEMMETGLSMCCQMRLSEMLRRSAERTMQAMVAVVFQRLQTIEPEEVEQSTSLPQITREASETNLRMLAPDPTSGKIPAASSASEQLASTSGTPIASPSPSRPVSRPDSPTLVQSAEEVEATVEYRPYGLPSIKELLRVLISLLNPHDQQHTDSMRLMALGILNIAFEVGGKSISKFPILRSMVADELCKHLFQLARSENPQILGASLRVVATVFDTLRSHLKLQQELFLSFLMDRLVRPSTNPLAIRKSDHETELDNETWNAPNQFPSSTSMANQTSNPSAHNRESSPSPAPFTARVPSGIPPPSQSENRELLLETLSQCARSQDKFWSTLWISYDCDTDCDDIFERLIRFLCRGVYPLYPNPTSQAGPISNAQLLCLDTILGYVEQLSRSNQQDSPSSQDLTITNSSIDSLTSHKAKKRLLLEGATRFNAKPKTGLAFLAESGLIYENPAVSKPKALAIFLKGCPRLDKRLLGDFISRPEEIETLKEFIALFDFNKHVISDAMRELLEAFRLPGEAQQIARITETFASVYFDSGPDEIKSADAAYVLSYSVIMLNTDLHNPQNQKRRMTVDDYRKNLRGVNDGADFSPAYLQAVYDSIQKNEIIMPEEHSGQAGFEYAWKELLRRTRSAGPLVVSNDATLDRAMFSIAWKPVISAIAYAFNHFTDEYVLQRAIGGFQQCATLASRFGLHDVFDFTVIALAKITGLTAEITPTEIGSFPSVQVEGQKVTVSAMALRFGTSFKAQLAAVVLFTIVNDNSTSVQNGWTEIFEIYANFFAHSLLPQSLTNMAEFLAGTPSIQLKPRTQIIPPQERRNDGGLLSTLSSYLLSPYGAGPDGIGRDITDEDIENTLCTLDCIASCRIDDLYRQIIKLPPYSLVLAVKALSAILERETLDKVRRSGSIVPGGGSPASFRGQLPYNPCAIFELELLVSIVAEAESGIADTWPVAFEIISRLLKSAQTFHITLVERAVVGLLRLASIVARQQNTRPQVFSALELLTQLPGNTISALSEQLATGLERLLSENETLLQVASEWNLVYALWAATAARNEAAVISFDLVSRVANGSLSGGLKAENFVGFVQVLNAFATAANVNDKFGADSDDPAIARGKQALDMIRDSQNLANTFISESDMPSQKAWSKYWLPVLAAYSQQSVNGCREIRQTALGNLQRTLIAHEILSNAEVDLTMIFERLIFPMLDELLKPQIFRRDPEGMGETRLRASALLCKIFLHYLIHLSERQGMDGMTQLWMKILGYLDRFMHSGRRDQMYEAVPESLKNVLLVMSASGYLASPDAPGRTSEQARLWDATFDRLDIFLPNLKPELFPPQPKKEPSPVLPNGA